MPRIKKSKTKQTKYLAFKNPKQNNIRKENKTNKEPKPKNTSLKTLINNK